MGFCTKPVQMWCENLVVDGCFHVFFCFGSKFAAFHRKIGGKVMC